MRLNAPLFHQPSQVLSRSIGGVGGKPRRPEIEAILRPFYRATLGEDLGLADSRGRLDIDDDRMFEVDQVVGAVGEEGSLVRRGGEARGRIRWRQILRLDRRRVAEGRIVECFEVLADSTALRARRQTIGRQHRLWPADVGSDETGIDRKAFAAYQLLGDALPHGHLEHLAQQIAVTEPPVPVLRES